MCTSCAAAVPSPSNCTAGLLHARRPSVGICCDSCGAEGRDGITTLYVPSCTSVTLLLIAVIVIISIISDTTTITTTTSNTSTNTNTHPLLGFALMRFPSDEAHISVTEIC
jgi:hypothetical protein